MHPFQTDLSAYAGFQLEHKFHLKNVINKN